MNNYDDIINLPPHKSNKYPHMPINKRAAQFAPFSALTGYNEAINETKRQTQDKIELDEEYKLILNNKLKDKDYFKNVKPSGDTIIWENGEDVCPEDLYYKSKKK